MDEAATKSDYVLTNPGPSEFTVTAVGHIMVLVLHRASERLPRGCGLVSLRRDGLVNGSPLSEEAGRDRRSSEPTDDAAESAARRLSCASVDVEPEAGWSVGQCLRLRLDAPARRCP